jgi:cell division protein FtsL
VDRLACAVLLVLVLVSSISVIYVRHQNRTTFVALHQAGQDRDRLNIEWGQLLIEESLWSFPHRIEKDAVEVLGMKMPQPEDIRLVEY